MSPPCRACPPSPKPCPATRPPRGSASACPRGRPRRSSRRSTPKRTAPSPIPKCRRAWPSWGASRSWARRRTSARSSPPRRRSGRRSSSPRAPRWNELPSARSGNPALIFRVLVVAGLLPVGAAKARAARGDLGLVLRVLAQARSQREAQHLGQPIGNALEARDDRIGLERAAIVEIAAARAPHQGPLAGIDAVAELERSQLAGRLPHEQVEIIVVEPAPLARGVVLQYAQNLSQHGNASARCPLRFWREAQAKVPALLAYDS